MKMNFRQRDVRYEFANGCLVRTVTDAAPEAGGSGKTYQHRCTRQVFETVAHAVNETPADGEGTSQFDIVQRESLPYSQVNVALEFLKERGVVDVRHRRCYPASTTAFEDAMIEFLVLGEEDTAV
jgi:hypothetical protein